MVVLGSQPDGYFTYILRQMASSRFDAFSESLERLWEMASSSLGSVVRFCRLSSFLDMLDFARFNDTPDPTFADILERSMRRKGFADALLAGWVGLRWILVTADQRARDLRHIVTQYLKQPRPSKGYRLRRNETHIIAEVFRRKFPPRKKGQRTTNTLPISRMLALTPRSLESADMTEKILAHNIDQLIKLTREQMLGLGDFINDRFCTRTLCGKKSLSKAIEDTNAAMTQEIQQQVRAALDKVREECRAEMRQELAMAKELKRLKLRKEMRAEMRRTLAAAESAQHEAAAMMEEWRKERAADASRIEAATLRVAEKEKRGRETILQDLAKMIAESESRIRAEVNEAFAKNRTPTDSGSRGGAGTCRAPMGGDALEQEELKEDSQDEGGDSAEDEDSLQPPS
eukprot:g13482.t1